MNIPVLHVEAGLRSFNKSMPEEINRIMADHVSTILFTPTQTGLDNLVKEGFSATTSKPFTQDNPGLLHCGDVMYDNSLFFKKLAFEKSTVIKDYKLKNKEFILCTVHRDNNTDDEERLNSIFSTLNKLSLDNQVEIVMPLHPRTSRAIEESLDNKVDEAINKNPLFKLLPPVSFLDMIMLESECQMVITDSGGVQKEAFFFKKPSIILRTETEWKEIVDAGVGMVTDVKKDQILDAFAHFKLNASEFEYPSIFGDGNAAGFICQTILNNK
jgi:UDP-GlcNAc3NAcA epimerase